MFTETGDVDGVLQPRFAKIRDAETRESGMKTLGGKHRQRGGREITYWASFGMLSSGEVAIYAVFTEPMWTTLGGADFTLAPSVAPIELRVRSTLLSYIEATELGPGTQPGPEWIGWKGRVL